MRTRVKDVMTTEVVVVEEATPYKQIVETMHRGRVRAVPVLDASGQVRGVVSESDLLFKEADPDGDHRPHLSTARRREWRKSAGTDAAGLMTTPAIIVSRVATVEQAARLMRAHRVGQLPVVDALSGRIIGIVSRSDVLGVYRRSDEDIRRDVVHEVIGKEFEVDPGRFDVRVRDGQVTVQGKAERLSQVRPLTRAIRRVEGVVAADIRLGYDTDDVHPDFSVRY